MRTLASVAFALLGCAAFGQTSSPDDPISTTRPSFSDSPTIVPVRHLQIESGLTYYSRSAGSPEVTDFGEALLRYGLVPRLELRLQLPTYFLGASGGPSGFDNTTVGVSYYLGKVLGFDLGIVPTVAFPTGAQGIRDEMITPSVLLNGQHDLGGGSNIGGTIGQTYEKSGSHRFDQTEATLVYVHPCNKLLSAFVEYAGYFDQEDRPTHYAHVGLQLLTTKTSQIDLHGGVGLNASTPHAFVGAGYSVRF